MSLLNPITRAIFPHVCEICAQREAGPADSFICAHCREIPDAVKPVEPPFCQKCGLWYSGAITTEFRCANCAELTLHFEYARSAAQFSGLVKEVIHRFKYGRNEWFEPFLAELLIERALADLRAAPVDLIVPIPLHKTKHHTRGFNQAERLAARLAQAANLPMNPSILRRVIDTNSQAGLDRDDRAANVRNAFAFVGPPLTGQRILLIDDVLTTGLTASACARELIKHGARDVRVWTVARTRLD
jgi:competence protein ComFC